jgi:hypothetical protein
MATRRELLKGGATAGLLALLPSVSFVASAAADRLRPRDPGELLSRSTFKDLLFDDFRVERSGQLAWTCARSHPDLGAGKLILPSENAFSLRFVGPPSR